MIDLELGQVTSGGSEDEFARVTFRLFGKESECDDSPVTLYAESAKEGDGWEVILDLTPEQIRAIHSFLGFAIGELRVRAAVGGCSGGGGVT